MPAIAKFLISPQQLTQPKAIALFKMWLEGKSYHGNIAAIGAFFNRLAELNWSTEPVRQDAAYFELLAAAIERGFMKKSESNALLLLNMSTFSSSPRGMHLAEALIKPPAQRLIPNPHGSGMIEAPKPANEFSVREFLSSRRNTLAPDAPHLIDIAIGRGLNLRGLERSSLIQKQNALSCEKLFR
jgi:hypothetical protein